jgi:glycosyltransferase involved in cell wall biosynthesis
MPISLRFGDVKLDYSPWTVTTSYLRERTLWSSADAVAAVSGAVKGDLVSHYGIAPEKIGVVYNGVDANLFRPIPDAEFPNLPELRGKKVVLYVGHFGLRKGLIHLVRAMRRVVEEVPETALVCIGGVPDWLRRDVYWEYLRQLISTNGLEGKVFLLDKAPNKTLPVFYSACSVFVLPSYYEAFAKVVIEAMACAKPVVVTREGGPSEAVQNGSSSAGLLVDFGSEEQLAEALITILQDERMAREMGTNGRKQVTANFTWEKVAQRINSVYQKVTDDLAIGR